MAHSNPEIFFHVGLGKVASTYLQYRVFPHFKGLHYIQRTQFRQASDIIQNSASSRFLISNEHDRQLEREVGKFMDKYPGTKTMILLRRHDSWIASQYRRFIKNGMDLDFDTFLDLKNDQGFWKQEELCFFPRLEFLEKVSGHPPLVLFHEDLKENPFESIDKIAAYTGASYDRSDIVLKPFHKSYSEKQLKIIRSFRLYQHPPGRHPNPVIHRLRRYWRFFRCYSILYPAALIPASWVSREPLIPDEQLAEVKAFYAEDWQKCRDYAARYTSGVTAL